jgi:glycolate oxidase iron-sulfur subunit
MPDNDSSLIHLKLELDKLKSCIHCGLCLPACPTYLATGSEAESPRGRLYLMKKMLEGDFSEKQVSPHLDQCLACHGCETVCPSGVEYGTVLMAAREDIAKKRSGLRQWLKKMIFRFVLPNHFLLLMAGFLLRVYQQSGLQKVLRDTGFFRLASPLEKREKLLPVVPPHRSIPDNMVFGSSSAGETVVLLLGCVMDVFYNNVHWDTIEVLVANGYQVKVPPARCCGALAHHAGEVGICRDLARESIEELLRNSPDWIVSNSAGCGSTLKAYAELLHHDSFYSHQAEQFSGKVVDIMELLAKKPLAPFKHYALHETIAYHPACHLYHVQGIRTQPVDLLKQVPGIHLVSFADAEACCGSAGLYNIEHPEMSETILNDKIKNIQAVCEVEGVTTIATGNPGCMLQIEKGARAAGLDLRVRHPVSVLAEAYRHPGQKDPMAQ